MVDGRETLPGLGRTVVLHLFSGPYLTVGPHRCEIPEGCKRLLAFVALKGRRVERRHAAGALWPSGSDGRAAGNLRSALWRLRGAGIGILTIDQRTLTLNDGVLVDVHTLREWAARLIEDRALDSDLVMAPASIEALDLLPGCYDDWALVERERIRQRVLHALEALSRRLVVERRFADAVEAAMLAMAAEPLRESAQRVLIEAHLAEGNLIEARRRYQTFHALLLRELGVSPTRELARLLESFPSFAGDRGAATVLSAALLG